MKILGCPIQESKKSGFHQRHSKVCCGQNLEEGACFTQPTNYLEIVTSLYFLLASGSRNEGTFIPPYINGLSAYLF